MKLNAKKISTSELLRNCQNCQDKFKEFTPENFKLLKQVASFYKLIFDQVNETIVVAQDNRLEYFNERLIERLGYSEQELAEHSFLELVHPDDQPLIANNYFKILNGENIANEQTFQVIAKNNTILWVESRATFLPDWNGRPAVLVVLIDVTERKKHEETKRHSEQVWQALLNSSASAIFMVNNQRKLVEGNPAFVKISGYTLEELKEKTFEHFFHPDDVPILLKRFASRVRGEPVINEYHLRIISKDGEIKWLYLTANWIPDMQMLVGQVYDVTELMNAQEALRESEEKFKALAEKSQDVIMRINSAGQILYVNSAVEKYFRMTTADIIGKKRYQLGFPPELVKKWRDAVSFVFSNNVPHRAEFILPEGHIVDWILTPEHDKNDKVVNVMAFARDITKQRKDEELLQRSLKIESLGILAGGIAHDFNNILTAIMGNTNLAKHILAEKSELANNLTAIIEDIEDASLRAKGLTQQLLTFAKGGAPIKKLGSLAELLPKYCNFNLSGTNIAITYNIAKDLWSVEMDTDQISQVVSNFIINARQAMSDVGEIKVQARNVVVREKDERNYSSLKPGKYVEVKIIDNGIGIPKENLNKIFDPYFTTKQKTGGQGLGLSSAYSIIKSHEGFVNVESEENEGTTITFLLPASELIYIKSPELPKGQYKLQAKVLVIDDDPMVQKTLKNILEHMGCIVATAPDGTKGLEMYREAYAAEKYDTVIMDLTIPGAMGGKEMLPKLLEFDPEARAVVSSGYSNDPVMANYIDYGFKGVIAKPYDIESLHTVLSQVLEKNSG